MYILEFSIMSVNETFKKNSQALNQKVHDEISCSLNDNVDDESAR
jgi:hypothetical protein